jgi:cell pole-organizing protein PopZ
MGDINRDPSMEEILASIKRVIAEEGRAPARQRDDRAEDLGVVASSEEDLLELCDPVSEAYGLTSEDTPVAARQKLAALSALRQPESSEPSLAASDAALAAAVREMLRPMLKDWLDQRLPEMVETMVAREIARITGKSL